MAVGCGDDDDATTTADAGSATPTGDSGSLDAGASTLLDGAAGPLGGGDASVDGSSSASSDGGTSLGTGNPQASLFAMLSMIFADQGTTSYVDLIDTVGAQTIDFGDAREFSGLADLWVYDGSVFVSSSEALTITKFSVEGKTLVQTGQVSFANYGLTELGFWLHTFISPTKAYLMDVAGLQYIIWNPSTMTIVGKLPLPELANRDGLRPYPGYSDRSARLRDGLLYHPLYWTDQSFYEFTPDSRIAVIDTVADRVVEMLEVPCPGLDFASTDEAGNLYFSSWVFAPAGAAVLKQPATCVAKIPAGSRSAQVLFSVADLTQGRSGGVLQYLGNGRALLSVLHAEHAASPDVMMVANGANWRFWTLELATGTASMVDAIDWNAGGAYPARVGGKSLLLVPTADYASTTVYDLGDGSAARVAFQARGWATRLFEVR